MSRPIVAIVGRPNVGKSTLFNRLIGERLAIVEDLPGTTRDRIYGEGDWNGRTFTLIDTGGLAMGVDDVFGARVRAQAQQAIDEADVIVFLVDGIDGLTANDQAVADMLRTTSKPVVLGVNKADNLTRHFDAVEFFELGLGEPISFSGIHGVGTGDLLDEVVNRLPPAADDDTDDDGVIPRIAIVGRPNVGKSSIVNAILGQERVIVSEAPGTTRDAIDTLIQHRDQPVLLIDTAGIRRRGRIERGVEKYSVMRAARALDRCDIAIVVLDAADGLTAQDTHVIGYALDAFRGLIVAVNKWDLIVKDDRTMLEYTRRLREELRFLDWAPIVFVSAVTKQRLGALIDAALKVKAARDFRAPTGKLNQVIQDATRRHTPPSQRGRHLKILYATQTDNDPPTFVFFVNDPTLMHFSYKRYLENALRAAFGFDGTPLKLLFRARDESARD